MTESGFKPEGYLTFKDPNDGSLKGHSYGAVKFAKPINGAIGTMSVETLSGIKTISATDSVTVDFYVKPENMVIKSKAILSADGNTLTGKSTAEFDYQGKPASISYEWVATRM